MAGASVDAATAIGEGLIAILKRDNAIMIKAFRRQVRINMLAALEGVATNYNTTQLYAPDGQILPEPNCYLGIIAAMETVFNMFCPEFDEAVFEVMNACIEGKMALWKEHWLTNSIHLRTDYSERYDMILSFVSKLSGYDQIRAGLPSIPTLASISSSTTWQILNVTASDTATAVTGLQNAWNTPKT